MSGGGAKGGGGRVDVELVGVAVVLGEPAGKGGRNGSCGVRGSTPRSLKPLMNYSVYSDGDPKRICHC